LEAGNLLETQQAVPEMDNHGHLEDSRLIDRARAVGVVYEFAHPGVDETDDDRRKRLEVVPSFTFLHSEDYLNSTFCRPEGKKLILLKIAMPTTRLCKRIPMSW